MECAGTLAHTPGTHLSPTSSTVSVNSQELQRTVLPTGRATTQPGGFQVCLRGLRARLPRTSTGRHGAHAIRSGRRRASPGASPGSGPSPGDRPAPGPTITLGMRPPRLLCPRRPPLTGSLWALVQASLGVAMTSVHWGAAPWPRLRAVDKADAEPKPGGLASGSWARPTPPSAHLTNRKAGSR